MLPSPSSPGGSAFSLSAAPRESKQFVQKWEMGNCLESQAPHKHLLKNKSCYFNYGQHCFITSAVSHTFIRNLVINQSLQGRSCQGHPPGLQPHSFPGLALLEPRPNWYAAWYCQDSDFMAALSCGWSWANALSVDFICTVSPMKKGSEREKLMQKQLMITLVTIKNKHIKSNYFNTFIQ